MKKGIIDFITVMLVMWVTFGTMLYIIFNGYPSLWASLLIIAIPVLMLLKEVSNESN